MNITQRGCEERENHQTYHSDIELIHIFKEETVSTWENQDLEVMDR